MTTESEPKLAAETTKKISEQTESVTSASDFLKQRKLVEEELGADGVSADDLRPQKLLRGGDTYIYNIQNAGYVVRSVSGGSFSADVGGGGPDQVARDYGALASEQQWPQGIYRACAERPEDLARIIGLTVLDGVSLVDLRDACDGLSKALSALYPAAEGARFRPAAPIIALDKAMRCERFSTERAAEASRTERVGFRSAQDRRRALKFLMTEDLAAPAGAIGVVSDWIRELGADPGFELRQIVGVAVGEAARENFERCWSRFIQPWGGQSRGDALDAMSTAMLRICDSEDPSREVLRERVIEWARGRNGKRLRAAAARFACNAMYGVREFDAKTIAIERIVRGISEALLRNGGYVGLVLAQRCYAFWFCAGDDDRGAAHAAASALAALSNMKLEARSDLLLRRDITFLALTEMGLDVDCVDGSDEAWLIRRLALSDQAIRDAGGLFASALLSKVTGRWALGRLRQIVTAPTNGDLDMMRVQNQLFSAARQASGRPDLDDVRAMWVS